MARRDTQGKFYRQIVQSLIERRKTIGLTQVGLASRMKTDQSQISKFERCERRLDIIDYARYCEAVGLDPGLLLRQFVPAKK